MPISVSRATLPGVRVTAYTEDRKLVGVRGRAPNPKAIHHLMHATYLAGITCPVSCPYRQHGCYGEQFPVRWIANRIGIEAQVYNLSPEEIASNECEGILLLPRDADIRGHVYGNFVSRAHARAFRDASEEYLRHANASMKRTVDRKRVFVFNTEPSLEERIQPEDVEGISYIRSVKTAGELALARVDRVAAAMVVPLPVFQPGTFTYLGQRFMACRYDVDGTPCVECRACMHSDSLVRTGTAIAFTPGGSPNRKVGFNALVEELHGYPDIIIP